VTVPRQPIARATPPGTPQPLTSTLPIRGEGRDADPETSIDAAENANLGGARPEDGPRVLEPTVRLVRDGGGARRTAADSAGQQTGPLDIEAARVIAKVRWLMLSVTVFTFVSVAGVIGIIGYRVYSSAGIPDGSLETTLTLPKGAKIIQTAVAEGRIVVTIELKGAVEIRSFDIRTLKPVGRLIFSSEQ
jgi:hypothetical protein